MKKSLVEFWMLPIETAPISVLAGQTELSKSAICRALIQFGLDSIKDIQIGAITEKILMSNASAIGRQLAVNESAHVQNKYKTE